MYKESFWPIGVAFVTLERVMGRLNQHHNAILLDKLRCRTEKCNSSCLGPTLFVSSFMVCAIKLAWAHFRSAVCPNEVYALTELGWAHVSGTRLGTLQGAVCPREVC